MILLAIPPLGLYNQNTLDEMAIFPSLYAEISRKH